MPIISQSVDAFSPKVYIFAKNIQPAQEISKKIYEKKCETLVVAEYSLTREVAEKMLSDKGRPLYFLVLLNGYTNLSLEKALGFSKELLLKAEEVGAKTIFVLPFGYPSGLQQYYENIENIILKEKQRYTGIVYIGDLITTNYPFSPCSFLDSLTYSLVRNNKLPAIGPNEVFYPLSVEYASGMLVSSVFSMSSYRTKSAIVGLPLEYTKIIEKAGSFGHIVKLDKGKVSLAYPEDIKDIKTFKDSVEDILNEKFSEKYSPEKLSENRVNSSLVPKKYPDEIKERVTKKIFDTFHKAVVAAIPDVKQGVSSPNIIKRKTAEVKITPNKKTVRKGLFLFLFLIFITFSPVFLLDLSSYLSHTSDILLTGGFLQSPLRFLKASENLAKASSLISYYYLRIPKVGSSFNGIYNSSVFAMSKDDVQESVVNLSGRLLNMVNYIGDTSSSDNFITEVDNAKLDLGDLYTKLGFLESEWGEENTKGKFKDNPFFKNGEINNIKESTLLIQRILGEKDSLFGVQKPASYLLLLQDDSEVRPSGGKIVAMGVVKFSGGKISDFQVYDINEITGKTGGLVEPPQPLRKYFGLNSWDIGESNYYINFLDSASKIEWFLDKSLDISVDGVVSLNVSALGKIAARADMNSDFLKQDINKDTLTNFFQNIESMDDKQKLRMIFSIPELLQQKNILIFLHNKNSKDALNDLGWDGSIKSGECKKSCYKDIVGTAEYSESFGRDKIAQEAELAVSLQEGLVKRKMTVYLENKNEFTYKTYLRVLANPDSGFSPVRISTASSTDEINPEVYGIGGYKEAGIYIELKPGETKAAIFSWENGVENFNKMDEYLLTLRKQPGIEKFPLKMTIRAPQKDVSDIKPAYSLTGEGVWDYNTEISTDFTTQVYLNKNE